jgi:hypothetical protein
MRGSQTRQKRRCRARKDLAIYMLGTRPQLHHTDCGVLVSMFMESGQNRSERKFMTSGGLKNQRPDKKNGGEYVSLFNRSANQGGAITFLGTGDSLLPITWLTFVGFNRAPYLSTSAISTLT